MKLPMNGQNGSGPGGGGGGKTPPRRRHHGSGAGGGGGGGGQPAHKPDLYGRAQNDVMLGIQPILDELRRAGIQAGQDYRTSSDRVGDIYGGLDRELAPLTGQYQQQSNQIATGLQGQLAGLTSLLGSSVEGVPAGEISAGAGMFGTLGAGGLEQLASQQQRNVGYNTSAIRQGGIESEVTQRNYLADLQNFTNELERRRIDTMQAVPDQFKSRLDELRDQQWQRSIAEREYQLRADAAGASSRSSRALGNYVRDQASFTGGGHGGGGGGGHSDPARNPGAGTGGPVGQGGGGHPGTNPHENPNIPRRGGLMHDFIQGDTRWRDLTGTQQQRVERRIPNRTGAVLRRYMGAGNPQPMGPYSPQQLVGLIRSLGRH